VPWAQAASIWTFSRERSIERFETSPDVSRVVQREDVLKGYHP